MRFIPIFIAFLFTFYGCQHERNTLDESPIFNTTILKYLDEYISMDSVKGYEDKVFKVYLSRRYNSTLIRIMPVNSKSQIINDYPYCFFKRGNKVILVYCGLENAINIDTTLKTQVLTATNDLVRNDISEEKPIIGSTFDPIVWEINISNDSIHLDKNPDNPYDYQLQESKFIPPLEK